MRIAFSVLTCLALLAPAAATAQEEGTGTAEGTEARDRALQHFQRGLTLMEGENWEGALLEFERSIELYPTRAALFNLGMCQKAMFRYVAAMQTFQVFLDRYRDQASAEDLERVASAIAELEELLAEITVQANVVGAEIFVDGESAGTAPLGAPVRVVAGRHTVEARAPGHITATQTIPVTSGDRVTVSLDLSEVARVGGLRVEANVPGAEVWIDGDRMGTAPYRGVLPEGEHEIEVRAPGYTTQIQSVAIATGDERIVTIAMSEPGGADPAWFWSMVGLTGAATVATVALGAVVLVKDGEYEALAQEDRTVELQDEGKRLMLATDICMGVAIAAAVTATVLAFTTDWGGEESSDAAEPSVTASGGVIDGGGALFVIGRF
jgi:hypothetical protein